MKKQLIALLILFGLFPFAKLSAEGINFVHDKSWKEILFKAKKENKMIFLDAYASWCGPCKYLQKNVFTDPAVGEYYNKTFINVKMDMEEGEGPALSEELGVTSYPTMFFMNGDGKVLHKSIGAMGVEEFISLGKDAADPEKQFYNLKERAKEGKLSSAQFLNWLEKSQNNGDDDIKGITSEFIKASGNNISDKNMLRIIFEYGTPDESQLTFLYKNKDEIAKTLGKSTTDLEDMLLNKVRGFAMELSINDDAVDLVKYEQLINKFCPEQSKLEGQKFKVKYLYYTKDYISCLDEFKKLITDSKYKLDGYSLAALSFNYAELITNMDRAPEFISAVNNYQLLTKEKDCTYYKDLSLFSIYLNAGDSEKSKEYSNKIAESNAPEEIKEVVKESMNKE